MDAQQGELYTSPMAGDTRRRPKQMEPLLETACVRVLPELNADDSMVIQLDRDLVARSCSAHPVDSSHR